jgi:hypothetical protein
MFKEEIIMLLSSLSLSIDIHIYDTDTWYGIIDGPAVESSTIEKVLKDVGVEQFGPIKLAVAKFETVKEVDSERRESIPIAEVHYGNRSGTTQPKYNILSSINTWIDETLLLGSYSYLPNATEVRECDNAEEEEAPSISEPISVISHKNQSSSLKLPRKDDLTSSPERECTFRRSFSDTGIARSLRRNNADSAVIANQMALWKRNKLSLGAVSDKDKADETATTSKAVYVEIEGIYDGQCDLYFDPFTMQQLSFHRDQTLMLNAVRNVFSRIVGMRDVVENESATPVQLVGADSY